MKWYIALFLIDTQELPKSKRRVKKKSSVKNIRQDLDSFRLKCHQNDHFHPISFTNNMILRIVSTIQAAWWCNW